MAVEPIPRLQGRAILLALPDASPLPTIERAQYEKPDDTQLVRLWLSDGSNTHCSDDDASPFGQQLQVWKAAGNTIEAYAPAPITTAEVDIECARRNSRGQELFLKSGKVISIATKTREDFDNINFSSDTALTLIAKTIPALAAAANAIDPIDPKGPAASMMKFRDFYNIEREVTYHEMAEISVRITGNIVTVNQAAHLLKDQYPNIPRDYTDDSYWPHIPLPPNQPPPIR